MSKSKRDNDTETGKFQLEDIQRAIDGDLGARLRVEIFTPWMQIINDIVKESAKREAQGDDPAAVAAMDKDLQEFIRCLGYQVVAIWKGYMGNDQKSVTRVLPVLQGMLERELARQMMNELMRAGPSDE